MTGTTNERGGYKPIIKTVCALAETESTQTRRAIGFVQDIDAVAPAMSTRDRRRLPVHSHVQVAQVTKIAELPHRSLATKSAEPHTYRNGAVNATVRIAARGESWRLEGENLVRCELVLIECLLLLL